MRRGEGTEPFCITCLCREFKFTVSGYVLGFFGDLLGLVCSAGIGGPRDAAGFARGERLRLFSVKPMKPPTLQNEASVRYGWNIAQKHLVLFIKCPASRCCSYLVHSAFCHVAVVPRRLFPVLVLCVRRVSNALLGALVQAAQLLRPHLLRRLRAAAHRHHAARTPVSVWRLAG